jgi:hypothetical protein
MLLHRPLIRTVLAAAVVTALLPAAAAHSHGDRWQEQAHEQALGADHLAAHARVWRMQERARARWLARPAAERRRIEAREQRRRQRAYRRAGARAAARGPASSIGRWDPPFPISRNFRGYAIHAVMLHTGKVLWWGYPIHAKRKEFRGNVTYAWLWDPAKGKGRSAFREVTPRNSQGQIPSLYCSGLSFLPDGRVLVVGGNLKWPDEDPNDAFTEFAGLNDAYIFDPVTEQWTQLDRPAGSHGRWYPTQLLLPDGRTFITSGLTEEEPGGVYHPGHEIYRPPSPGSPRGRFELVESDAQKRIIELYPHLFTMPDGKVLLAGPDTDDSAILDPAALSDPAVNPWRDLPPLAHQRIGGNAVLMPEGPAGSTRVLTIAGTPFEKTGLPPTETTEQIDTARAAPAWTFGPSLNVRRYYPNTVLLPDRSMVVVGGSSKRVNYKFDGRQVELYDPGANRFRLGPAQAEERAYHSTAWLLPDGRVVSAGDDLSPTSNGERSGSSPDDTAEIYSPPYLFRGERPLLTGAPQSVRWNVPFAAESPDPVRRAVLIAPAAVTHSNDMNQRLVPLRVIRRHRRAGLTLTSPPSPAVAPPGWYMLFLLNGRGVPSVAKWVKLNARAPAASAVPRRDTRKPRLSLRTSRPGARRVKVRVRLDEPGTVAIALRQGKWRRGAKLRLAEPGVAKTTLRARKGKLKLTVTARDRAGNATVRTRRIRPR